MISRICVVVVLVAGCRKDEAPAPPPPPAAAAEPAAAPEPAPPAPAAAAPKKPEAVAELPGDGEVQPVYPRDVTPDPLAAALCNAIHEVPAERRAACCGSRSGAVATTECVRNLSAALASKAVTLSAEDVQKCGAAVARAHEGCEWVGPWPATPPRECDGILRGTLPEGAVCRSTLECSGTLSCRGVGPTDPGVCSPPLPDGATCGAAVDALAVYTGQRNLEVSHPECAGFCMQHRCRARVAAGAPCQSNVHCGPGLHCDGKACVPGATAALGAPCADGGCEEGARCLGRVCVQVKVSGDPCASDLECRAACVKEPSAAAGVCGKRCTSPMPGR